MANWQSSFPGNFSTEHVKYGMPSERIVFTSSFFGYNVYSNTSFPTLYALNALNPSAAVVRHIPGIWWCQ